MHAIKRRFSSKIPDARAYEEGARTLDASQPPLQTTETQPLETELSAPVSATLGLPEE